MAGDDYLWLQLHQKIEALKCHAASNFVVTYAQAHLCVCVESSPLD